MRCCGDKRASMAMSTLAIPRAMPSIRRSSALESLGYSVAADERPARIVLESAIGKVDLHPIVMLPSGAGVQTGFDGQTFEYPPGSLEAEGEIGGHRVRCGHARASR